MKKSNYLATRKVRLTFDDIMERTKIHLEYLLKATSKSILWASISTPSGWEGWFADRVSLKDKIATFYWGKTEHREAEIIGIRAFSYIRLRWLDDENECEYFEMRMTNNELTNDVVLEIIDFADADEANDLCELWEAQVDTLRRTCGF